MDCTNKKDTRLGFMRITLDFNKSFPHSSWDVSRRPRQDSIQIIYDEIRKANVASFNWKPGERANNGFRAELSDATFPPANKNIYYRYGLFIPEEFNIEPESFVVITQWHTPGSRQKPPLALRLRHTKRLDVTLNHTDSGTDFSARGSGQIMFAQIPDFKTGVWNDFEYLVRWCSDDKGSVQMKINQEIIAQYTGVTNYADQTTAPYFKYGIYPPVGNAFELNMLASSYTLQVEPAREFIIARGFNPDL